MFCFQRRAAHYLAHFLDTVAAGTHKTLDERGAPAHRGNEVHAGEVHSASSKEAGLLLLVLYVLTYLPLLQTEEASSQKTPKKPQYPGNINRAKVSPEQTAE